MSTRHAILGVLATAVLLVATAASAEFTLERRLALQPGGTFTLESDVGAVVVTGDSTSGAEFSLSSSIDDFDKRFDLKFDERPGAVTVSVKRKGAWPANFFSSFRGGKVELTVHVPRTTTVHIDTAGGSIQASSITGPTRVRTSGGGLTVNDVNGRVDADTSGGPISVQRITGDVRANTSGGGITISDITGGVAADTSGGSIEIDAVSGDVDASTSGGGVRVRGARGRVQARSSGGPVDVAFAPGNSKGGSLSSSGGGVRAAIDPAANLSIDAVSSGGGVTTDVPLTVRGRVSNDSLNGQLNAGGAVLTLRSSGGGVRIAPATK